MNPQSVAVITGGASGIGQAITELLLKDGWNVVVADINVDNLKHLFETYRQDHADQIRTIQTDVSQEEDVQNSIKFAVSEFGQLNVLVNNAGVGGAFGRISEIQFEDWKYTFNVLMDSVFFGIKHASQQMIHSGIAGSIVSIASTAGIVGGISPHAYSAAKAAVISLTRTAAVELASHRIRVNAVSPGVIGTPLVHRGDSEKFAEKLTKVQPWPDAGTPDDIASMIHFLAGKDSTFITGQSIVVDGGLLAGGPGKAFMDFLELDAGEKGFVGVNKGSTGQKSVIRRDGV